MPSDFLLRRDCCSYGYFLLSPNFWGPRLEQFSRVVSLSGGPALVEVTQPGATPGKPGRPLVVRVGRTLAKAEKAELRAQLTRMFRLDEDGETLAEFHAVDPRSLPSGRGRLFRSPTLFEDVIKTVTSCNVTWPNTVNMNRRLCEVLGESVKATGRGGVTRYAFPSPQKLARTRPQTLRARCRVGYRDARMIELARLFSLPPNKGGLDQAWIEDPATPDEALHATLIELPGIGPYAAANIMQTLGRFNRIPLDTESVRHGRTILKMKGTSARIMKRMRAHYKPFGAHAFRSYWFELWDYYENRHGPAWTWERDSTGKMFTAALLNQPVPAPAKRE